MILIKKIIIDNFRGIEKKTPFNFDDAKLILCDAPNGSGKTTLLDGIEWCLTGKIGRIQSVYERRFTKKADQNLAYNRTTILKNKKRLNEDTKVELLVVENEKTYKIVRVQKEDTLLDPGTLVIYDEKNNEVKSDLVNEWMRTDTFYQYHIFDMQKAYNLLSNKKEDIEKLFSDFHKQYQEIDIVLENLELFETDTKEKRKKINDKKITEEVINEKKENIEKSIVAPENLKYDQTPIYINEILDVSKLTEEDLNNQISNLYECGYVKTKEIIEQLLESETSKKVDTFLKLILNEMENKSDNIKKYISEKMYDKAQRNELVQEKEVYDKLVITVENLAQNSEKIIALQYEFFTKKDWDKKQNEILEIKKEKQGLEQEIEVLSKGNNVLKMMSSLIADKKSVLDYRKELIGKGGHLICPICGSEDKFSNIPDSDILLEAQKYTDEHSRLLNEKTKSAKEKGEAIDKIYEEVILNAKKVVQLKSEQLFGKITNMDLLINECNTFAENVRMLNRLNSNLFSFDKLNEKEKIHKLEDDNKKMILQEDQEKALLKDVSQIFAIIKYEKEEKEYVDILREVTNRIQSTPQIVDWDIQLLSKKVDSLNAYIKNNSYKKSKEELQKALENNAKLDKQLEETDKVLTTTEGKIKELKSIKLDLTKAEYEKVGPYLTKIFHKLSRDTHIKNFQLIKRAGEKNEKELELLDEAGRPIMNMLSDGQLSVFMLSYFLGNAFQLLEKEKFPIYLMDDITSCMDDVNMLAFLDLVKYQLQIKNGVFDQLFFASCNSRVQALMEWKANACGISCKKINADDFSYVEVEA